MAENNHRHFRLFKPYGYLSQFTTNARHEVNKQFLGDLHNFPEGTMAIGRLDRDSEGLLLLTTDGKVSAKINRSTEKEYYAQVDGIISDKAILRLKTGVHISINGEDYTTKSCTVFKINQIPNFPPRAKKIRDERHGPTSWVSITLTEGKFRQVRKMTAAVGFPTLRLVRVRVGKITLIGLGMGEVEELDLFHIF